MGIPIHEITIPLLRHDTGRVNSAHVALHVRMTKMYSHVAYFCH